MTGQTSSGTQPEAPDYRPGSEGAMTSWHTPISAQTGSIWFSLPLLSPSLSHLSIPMADVQGSLAKRAKHDDTPDLVAVVKIVGYTTLARHLSPRDVVRLARTCRLLATETQTWWSRVPWVRSLPILEGLEYRDPRQVPVALFARPLRGLSVGQRKRLRVNIVPWLCRWGALAPLHALQQGGLTLDDIRSDDNRALRIACQHGHLPVVESLVAHGLTLADIRSHDNQALQWACLNGHLPIVEFLMAQGLTLHDGMHFPV
jgi:hypothetical protein